MTANNFDVQKLSGSTNGLGIKVTATATAGTTIHTATTGTTHYDMVSLWAQNNDADGETRTLTLEWGGTSTDNNIIVPVACKAGLVQLTPDGGLPLRNSLVIGAFADEANDVIIYGKVAHVEVT